MSCCRCACARAPVVASTTGKAPVVLAPVVSDKVGRAPVDVAFVLDVLALSADLPSSIPALTNESKSFLLAAYTILPAAMAVCAS